MGRFEFFKNAQGFMEQARGFVYFAFFFFTRSLLVQRTGNAALVAKSLFDLKALIVKPPCFVCLALILSNSCKIMQRGGNAILVSESFLFLSFRCKAALPRLSRLYLERSFPTGAAWWQCRSGCPISFRFPGSRYKA